MTSTNEPTTREDALAEHPDQWKVRYFLKQATRMRQKAEEYEADADSFAAHAVALQTRIDSETKHEPAND